MLLTRIDPEIDNRIYHKAVREIELRCIRGSTYRCALESSHEVEDNSEKRENDDGDRNVHKSMSQGFHEGMVQSSFLVSMYNATLREECRNFGHCGHRREEQGARNIEVSEDFIWQATITHKKTTPPREKYAFVASAIFRKILPMMTAWKAKVL